jgi:calcineurin-like phosphoesterase family protein
MDETMINNWNNVVGKDDVIFHIGDFAFHKKIKPLEKLLDSLNGKLHIIRGNHDTSRRVSELEYLEIPVHDYYELDIQDDEMDLDQKICMLHYPMHVWNKSHHGSWHLHGHCHGTLPDDDTKARIDVGVDNHGFTPVSYDEIKFMMTRKVFKPVDHHNERTT